MSGNTAPSSYLTFGDELSDSERKKIWDSGERTLNWTLELLALRDTERKEQWQTALQQQTAAVAEHVPTIVQATQMLMPASWPIDIEPPQIPEVLQIKPMRPRGKPHGSQFAQAYTDAKFIRQQWQRVFGRHRRKTQTANDVAAKYHNIQATQLTDYGRHRNRSSRRGS